MASSTRKQKVQDTKCSREFQTWWVEKYGMINKGDKAVCVLCSGTVSQKIVDLISSQALNKRKFDALLDEVNSVYNGLIMYNNVRWLSRGNVLQRFVDCLEEIGLFLQNVNNTHS
ncbi:general transcription factor II-I repeat domain-containing protein 2A [Trichonephila clavipes]|nr:general transcription factor II-I repeat domain-containing protein 2A [Trichonephila clavipes]